MNDTKKVLGPGELTRNDIEKFENRSEHLPQVAETVSLVQMAMQKGYEPEFISKMMDLQERNEARMAKQAYVAAMAEFKKDPPKIEKDKHVKFKTEKGVTEYTHADLASASEKINKALSQHGLSASWKTDQANGTITVVCTITHKLGHGESTSLTASPDATGSKNPIQAIGSTISYLERYTLLALTGLAAHGIDNNGNLASGIEYITEEQVKIIELLAEETNSDVLKWQKIDSLSEILARDFKKVEAGLRAKIKKQREPGDE